VLVKLAAIDTALLTLLLSNHLPSGLQLIGAHSSSVEGHLGTVDGAIDDVEVGVGEAKTAGVNLVEIAEDFKLEFSRKGW
jgi:hypothetical protein